MFKHQFNSSKFSILNRQWIAYIAQLLFEWSDIFHHVIKHHWHINVSIPSLQDIMKASTVNKKNRQSVFSDLHFEMKSSTKVGIKESPSIIPVSTASASFVFQCLAMFSERGSSGLGALRSAWMLIEKICPNNVKSIYDYFNSIKYKLKNHCWNCSSSSPWKQKVFSPEM